MAQAAAKEPFGVTLGAIIGHAICTGIAVIGGKLLASRISERMTLVAGGVLFILFALAALIQGPAGRKAPLLLKPQMVKNLKRGSIVVDLAAEAPTLGAPEGAYGNCSATKPGESYVTDGGVTVRARDRPRARFEFPSTRA